MDLNALTMRRHRLDLNKPVELKIRDAMLAVEQAGADVKLTAAVIKLQEAKDLVGDFIDDHGPTINPAIAFLRRKGILGEGFNQWIVKFDDGKEIDIVRLLDEYKHQG